MTDDLYHQTIMELVRAEDGRGLPDSPDATASVDNPLCGDRVKIAIRMDDNKVAEVGHEVRGCALCQAAAVVIARHAAGASSETLRDVSESVDRMLKDGAELPADAWPELVAFSPVRRYKSRHECVRLPFQALTAALAQTGSSGGKP
jgi:nitrogen fixation NifU-like protein